MSSAKSVARRLKYESNLISNLEARADAQDLVIRSLVTEVNRQVRYNQSALSAANLLCRSLSSVTGPDGDPVPEEVCVPYNVNRMVDIPVPHYVQRAVETFTPDPVQKIVKRTRAPQRRGVY